MRAGRSRPVVLVAIVAVLTLPPVAGARVPVFSVAGGAADGLAREGDAATRIDFWNGFGDESVGVSAFAGRPDGSFLFAAGERIGQVSVSGRWSTVAGTTASGPLGDGGPATRARLGDPTGLAVLADGGFLVSDTDGNRVRRVFPDGVIRTVAGTGRSSGALGDGGPAVQARVAYPTALAALPGGGFLVAAQGRIRRVASDGTISTFAGTGRRGFSGDGGPATSAQISVGGLAVQPDGGVLIAGTRRVRRVATDGTITTVAGDGRAQTAGDGGPAVRASFRRATGVHALSDGGFLIADPSARRVREVNAAGIISTIIGPSAFRDFAARAAYVGGPFRGPVHEGPFDIAEVSDGLLLRTAGAVLYVPTGAPRRPAIRITGARVGDHRLTLSGIGTQPGSLTVLLRRRGRRVARLPAGSVAAGAWTVRIDPGVRQRPHVARVSLKGAGGVAVDDVVLILDRRLAVPLAVAALDSAYDEGGGDSYYGTFRCRRFGSRRVDCELAEQESDWVGCDSIATVRLGRDGLLHERRYRCPRRGQPTFRTHPRYRGPATVLPVSSYL